jgi:glycosyltransferase involved in cell wall biosynthesis
MIPTLECGGSEKYVATLCNTIDKTKFDVTLIVINNRFPFYPINNDVVQINLHIANVRNALFKIRNIIKEQQPDIVFSAANHLNLLMAMFRWIFPKHIKFIARESSLVSHNISNAKLPVLYKPLMKNFYNRLDHVICQSVAMQQDLVDNFKVKKEMTTVIYNAVERMGDISFPEKSRPYKFITVARLSAEKGIDRIIKTLSLVKYPFQYFIIGDGAEKEILQNLVAALHLESQVFFMGQQQSPFSKMEDADLFLFGSHYEGFPNAVLEANALGIPVVAFAAAGGLDEIIKEEENGLLVKNDELQNFARAIEKALAMQFDRVKISANTLERFAIEKMIKQVEDLLAAIK